MVQRNLKEVQTCAVTGGVKVLSRPSYIWNAWLKQRNRTVASCNKWYFGAFLIQLNSEMLSEHLCAAWCINLGQISRFFLINHRRSLPVPIYWPLLAIVETRKSTEYIITMDKPPGHVTHRCLQSLWSPFFWNCVAPCCRGGTKLSKPTAELIASLQSGQMTSGHLGQLYCWM